MEPLVHEDEMSRFAIKSLVLSNDEGVRSAALHLLYNAAQSSRPALISIFKLLAEARLPFWTYSGAKGMSA